MQRILALLIISSLWLSTIDSHAHQTDNSYTTIELTGDSIRVILTFDITDLERAFHLDLDGNEVVERGELLAMVPEMYDYLQERFALAAGYTPMELLQQEGGFKQDEFGNIFINFVFANTVARVPEEIGFSLDLWEKFGARHSNLVAVRHGEDVQQAVLTVAEPRRRFVITGEVPLLAQLWQFTEQGIGHIFLGYDHIMFLIGLIIIGNRFVNLVKIVTAFTVAHSITLILAALQVLTLPPRLIESGIALSIVYVAAENFVILAQHDRQSAESAVEHRWLITFFFGLVHGFGFANVLRDLGLPNKALVGSLLAFNLGVEIGQIVIVALVFPFILWLSRARHQRAIIYATSTVILLFGAGWFVERTFGLGYMPI